MQVFVWEGAGTSNWVKGMDGTLNKAILLYLDLFTALGSPYLRILDRQRTVQNASPLQTESRLIQPEIGSAHNDSRDRGKVLASGL